MTPTRAQTRFKPHVGDAKHILLGAGKLPEMNKGVPSLSSHLDGGKCGVVVTNLALDQCSVLLQGWVCLPGSVVGRTSGIVFLSPREQTQGLLLLVLTRRYLHTEAFPAFLTTHYRVIPATHAHLTHAHSPTQGDTPVHPSAIVWPKP